MSAAAAKRSVRPARLAPIPPVDPRLLAAPLDFLEAEHYRQRVVLDHLDALAGDADAQDANEIAACVLCYLREDLVLHLADEERDLFPLLRRRAAPGDDVEFFLALLTSEHGRDHDLCTAVLEALARQPDGGGRSALKQAAAAFAETQRRHIAWENALLIPRARQLLQREDLVRLGQAFARRRGRRAPSAPLGERLARLIRRTG